jgi:very-short-patch-repair endonuclease
LRLAAAKRPVQDTSATDLLCFQLIHSGQAGFYREYRFAQSAMGREWEWDIAYPERLVAIEVDGGIWVQGAHAHPTTIIRNMEKRNWAARLGWRVLAFSPDQVRSGVALAFTEGLLRGKPVPHITGGQIDATRQLSPGRQSGRGRTSRVRKA